MNHRTYQHLMQGVTQMVPFMMVAALLMGISKGLNQLHLNHPIIDRMAQLSPSLLLMMMPVIAAFIAMSIAEKPGFMMGFVGGLFVLFENSGMMMAILTGFIAGYITLMMKHLFRKMAPSWNSLKSMVFIPLCVLIVIVPMFYLFVPLFSPFMLSIERMLSVEKGVVMTVFAGLSAMFMAYDMGGNVNKTMYLLGLISISTGNATTLMAAVMVGGMVPPLGLYLFGLLDQHRLSKEEKKRTKNGLLLGLSFVTEGAMFFAQKNKKATMPSLLMGSLVAGLVVAYFNVKVGLPHGGILVTLFTHVWYGFLIAVLSGTLVTAGMLLIRWKKNIQPDH